MASQQVDILVKLRDEATKQMQTIAGQASKMGSSINSSLKNAEDASKKFALALTAVVTASALVAKSFLDAAAEYEQTQISFETMLGSAEKAQVFLKDLSDFAVKTPFEIQDVEKNAKLLMAMGVETEKMLPTMKALGDVSAGLSVPMERLALNFGQVKAQGKLTGRELRDFAIAGVPLLDELTKVTGKTKQEIQDMVSNGDIGFAEVEKAFMNMTGAGGRFNDLMSKQATTFNGLWSNFMDGLTRIQRLGGQVLLNTLKPYLEDLVAITEGLTIAFMDFESELDKEKALSELSDTARNAYDTFQDLKKQAGELVTFFQDNERYIYAIAGAITGALVPAVGSLFIVLGQHALVLAPWVAVVGAIGLAVGAIQEYNDEFNKLIAESEASEDYWLKQADDARKYAKDIESVSAQLARTERAEADLKELQAKRQAELTYQLQERKKAGILWNDQAEQMAKDRLDEIDQQIDAQIALVKQEADNQTNRDRMMKRHTELTVEQFDERWKLAKQFFAGNEKAINQFLSFNKDASVEELKLFAKKLTEEDRLMAQARSQFAETVSKPLLQEVKLIITDENTSIWDKIKAGAGALQKAFINTGGIAKKLQADLGAVGAAYSDYADKVTDPEKGGGKASDELEKLSESAKKLKEDYENLDQKAGNALESFTQKHTDSIAKIDEQVVKLRKELDDLTTDLENNLQDVDTSIGQEIVKQQQLIADLKKEIAGETDQEEKNTLEARLKTEQAVLEKYLAENQDLADEIAEAQRRANLTDFERFVEDAQKKKESLQEEFNLRKAQIEEETATLLDQKDKEIAAYNEKILAYQALQTEFGLMKDNVENGLNDLTATTIDDVNAMIAKLNELEAKMEKLGVSSAPSLTASDIAGNTTTGGNTNNNNITINVSGSGNAQDIANAVANELQRNLELTNQNSQ